MRVPLPLSALSTAPARPATLPKKLEDDKVRCPLPRVSPLSMAPPFPLMALLLEKLEPETLTVPLATYVAIGDGAPIAVDG